MSKRKISILLGAAASVLFLIGAASFAPPYQRSGFTTNAPGANINASGSAVTNMGMVAADEFHGDGAGLTNLDLTAGTNYADQVGQNLTNLVEVSTNTPALAVNLSGSFIEKTNGVGAGTTFFPQSSDAAGWSFTAESNALIKARLQIEDHGAALPHLYITRDVSGDEILARFGLSGEGQVLGDSPLIEFNTGGTAGAGGAVRIGAIVENAVGGLRRTGFRILTDNQNGGGLTEKLRLSAYGVLTIMSNIYAGGSFISTNGTIWITNTGSGFTAYFADEAGDSTPFTIDASGNVVMGGTASVTGLLTVQDGLAIPGFGAALGYGWICTNATTGEGEWQVIAVPDGDYGEVTVSGGVWSLDVNAQALVDATNDVLTTAKAYTDDATNDVRLRTEVASDASVTVTTNTVGATRLVTLQPVIGLRGGNGSPEGVVTAAPGTIYSDYLGGVSSIFWIKTTGVGNTGWVTLGPLVGAGHYVTNTFTGTGPLVRAGAPSLTNVAANNISNQGTLTQTGDAEFVNQMYGNAQGLTNLYGSEHLEQLIIVGDSLSSYLLGWQYVLTNNYVRVDLTRSAVGSWGLSNIETNFDAAVAPYATNGSLVSVWIGANDYGPANVANWTTRITNYWWRCHTNGAKVMAWTILPRTIYYGDQGETNRVSINNFIRLSSGWDYLVDVAKLFDNPEDSVFFAGDGVHLSAIGQERLAQEVARVLSNGPKKSYSMPEWFGFYGTNFMLHQHNGLSLLEANRSVVVFPQNNGVMASKLILSNSAANADVALRLVNDAQAWDLEIYGTAFDAFQIRDITGTKTPFKIMPGCADNTVVLTNGMVGIGTVNPLYKLHINGTVYVNEGQIDTFKSTAIYSSQGNNTPLTIGGIRTHSTDGGYAVSLAPTTFNGSSGATVAVKINPIYNQTGTAGGTDLLIQRTETSVGSGNHYLFATKVGTVSKFSVTTAGTIYASGSAIITNAVAASNYVTMVNAVAVIADDQVVVTTDKSYIRLTSDSATPTDRTVVLGVGTAGQVLDIEAVGSNSFEILDDAALSGGGNVRLSGNWTATQYDILSLRFNGTDWVERSRSAN